MWQLCHTCKRLWDTRLICTWAEVEDCGAVEGETCVLCVLLVFFLFLFAEEEWSGHSFGASLENREVMVCQRPNIVIYLAHKTGGMNAETLALINL